MTLPQNPIATEAPLVALNKAKRAITESGNLLMQAQQANEAFAVDQNSVTAARRAMLAQKAYDRRMSAEVGAAHAAFSLLAQSESNALARTNAVMQQVTDAERQRTLQREVKLRGLRVNAMVEAMRATQKAFDATPGLPSEVVGPFAVTPPSAQQMTVGMTQTFRSPGYVERAGAFFPSDIRAAAGSFGDVSSAKPLNARAWSDTCNRCMQGDAQRLKARIRELVEKTVTTPDTAALVQRGLAMAEETLLDEGVRALPPTAAPTAAISAPATASTVANMTNRVSAVLTSTVSIAGFNVPVWLLAGAGFYIFSRR